ncbi:MAG: hypothetical protein K2H01_11505 [Ruminococcus sp.]|nr:hypothetical protein [Ruminococcus sp.]
MNCKEGANWLDSLLSVLGQPQYQNLWSFAQALTEIKEMLESERIVELPYKVGSEVYVSPNNGKDFYIGTLYGKNERGSYLVLVHHKVRDSAPSKLEIAFYDWHFNLYSKEEVDQRLKQLKEKRRIEADTCAEQKLPCKVGDTVYMPWLWNDNEGIACLEVTRIIIDGNKPYVETDFDTDDDDYSEAYNGGKFYFDDFGKTVFLTKPQAEQKLKKLKG